MEDFIIEITEDGARITRYCGTTCELDIPEQINGYPVIEIADAAFMGVKSLTAVVIPASVKRIGIEAFADCSNLTCAVMREGVTSIDARAFMHCVKLVYIYIPQSVTFLGHSICLGCSGLKQVFIPDKLCSGIRFCINSYSGVYVYDSQESLRDFVFDNCSNFMFFPLPAAEEV